MAGADTLEPGLIGEARVTVDATNVARAYAPDAVELYATPAMVGLMEHAAMNAVRRFIPDGSATVGTHLEIRHLAATPPGLEVTARAELIEVEGRRLKFRVEAFDPVEKIGEGIHERFIVELARLVGRAEGKAK
jgi:predicted thioesterase